MGDHSAMQEPSTVSDNSTTYTHDGASKESASALVIAASDKAGMEGIDRARIDAIILRESGDSAYMKQQRKRDQAVNVKIEHMKERLQRHQEARKDWRVAIERQLEPEMQELMASRRQRSTCVVVDMDMFYMACELLTRPELEKVPACVGSGMILTSNYCARQYGVRSAMAGWIADTLVEELSNGTKRLIHTPSNFELYNQKSHQVREVLSQYDPQLRAYSLDEAYLDVGHYVLLRLDNPDWAHEQIHSALRSEIQDCETRPNIECDDDEQPRRSVDDDLSRFPSNLVLSVASKVVDEMRRKVKEATDLTCSAGLAPNFMLAKIASDRNKPNGQLVVGSSHEEVIEFVHGLPTRKIPGIGRVTDKMLHAFNITTVRQLYEERALVRFLFTPATARFLLSASLGCSSSDHNTGEVSERSISKERTFQSGRPWSEVNARLEDIARQLSADMVEKDLRAHTLTVKVKLHTFDVLSRSRSMPRGIYIQAPDEMVKLATELVLELKKQHKGSTFSVRLLGIRCSNFQGDEERADVNQMNIEQFLCHEKKRASPVSALSSTLKKKNTQTTPESRSTSKPAQIANEMLPVMAATARHAVAEPDQESVQCPMCGQPIRETDNDAINRHVDSCLNSTMVRQAIKEESAAAQQRTKKQRLTDFFSTS